MGRKLGRRESGTRRTAATVNGVRPVANRHRRLHLRHRSGQSDVQTTSNASYIDEPVMRAGTGGNRYYHRQTNQYSVVALTNVASQFKKRLTPTRQYRNTFDHQRPPEPHATVRVPRTTVTRTQVREFECALNLYHYGPRHVRLSVGPVLLQRPIGLSGVPWELVMSTQTAVSLNFMILSGKRFY